MLKILILAALITICFVGVGGGIAAACLLDGMRKRIARLEAGQRLYAGGETKETYCR